MNLKFDPIWRVAAKRSGDTALACGATSSVKAVSPLRFAAARHKHALSGLQAAPVLAHR